ncbi:MAG: transglycosylase SLT domain-containing protein [Muribaculaceae bacterium]|nr:transglycosylase SLT domain-containing protein [Muribaculaceae bacterium]
MKKYLLSLIIATSAAGAFSQNNSGNVLDLKHSITDPAIVYPESFETDTRKLLESWFIKNYTSIDPNSPAGDDVEVTDEIIIERLSALPTVIEMPFNQIVRSYIDKYTKQGRSRVPALLGLGLYYNPIFEQALEEQGLPLELEYLPMIESSLDPNAVSRHGAAGLWQFMLATAKGLGMEVNSLVDERRDPYLSSEMAASYLKGLYDTYGDWSLAIAAYNCGPGNLNKAIRRAGGEAKDHDFWSIYNYLPEETRGYVPMFIAVNYVMKYYPEHNICPVLPTGPLVMDTVHVKERIHFDQISKVLDIPVEELRILNPQYRADIIPGSVETPRNLILPSQQIHAYLMSEEDIKNFDSDKYSPRSIVDPGEVPADALAAVEDIEIWPEHEQPGKSEVKGTSATNTIVHKVKAGETLASIAALYEVTPEQIKTSNSLRRSAVRVGQQLKITTSAPQAAMETAVAAVTQKPASTTAPKKKTDAPTNTKKKTTAPTSNPATHKIRSGENLSTIAKKYGVSVAELKKANGMTDDKLKAGATLKIPAKKTGTTSSKTPSKKSTSKKKRR